MSAKLLTFLTRAFAALAVIASKHLGDRQKYVGASDVSGCPRKAALNRLRPKKEKALHEQLVVALGHMIEDLLEKLFIAGGFTGFQREVEVAHPELPWFKCHIDFFARTKGGGVKVVELKSTKGLPNEPYSSWENQLYAQLGLVELNNPNAPIEGTVMVVDRANGHMTEFTGYKPDQDIMNVLVEKAKVIWAAINGGPEPVPEPGLLCGYCPFKEDCPAQQAKASKAAELPEEVSKAVLRYAGLKTHRDVLDNEMEQAKAVVLSHIGDKGRGKTACGGYMVNVTVTAESSTLDSKAVKAKYPEVFTECSKPKAGFTRFEVSALKKEVANG